MTQDLYSLWITFDDESQNVLQMVSDELSEEFGTPAFEVHLTLVPDVAVSEQVAVESAEKIASILRRSFVDKELYPGYVDFSNTFFQTVFLRLEMTRELLEGYIYAQKMFELPAGSPYHPHISLVYADLEKMNSALRQQIAERLDDTVVLESLVPTKLVVNKSAENPDEWETVGEFELF